MRPGLCALVLLAGCAHAPAAPVDALDRAAQLMSGHFDSSRQADAQAGFLAVSLVMWPIWTERDDARWFYVEQAMLDPPSPPYRQRVYRLSSDGAGGVVSEVFLIDDAARFRRGWSSGALATMTQTDLQPHPGCSVHLRPEGAGFRGATRGRDCVSRLRGARWASAEVELFEGGLRSWDRGFDAEGRQVWGATAGPYEFRRSD